MSEDESTNGSFRKYFAELVGTFALVFFGCGAATIAGQFIGFLGIAFAFGVVVLVMVYAIGPISGCHINPAITIAMLCARKISLKDAVMYIIVQCIGAILAAAVILGIVQGISGGYSANWPSLGVNGWGKGYNIGAYTMMSAFIAEVVLTFFFILVIFGATSEDAPKGFAGVAIGLTLFIVHLVGIPITGTSVNPARSLGPAVLVGGTALNQLWLFWVAPIIGGIIAAVVWMGLLQKSTPKPAEEKKAAESEEEEPKEEKEDDKEEEEEKKDED